MTKVNNVAAWAWEKTYMVIRYVDGEWWFYDAWDDGEKAMTQAWEVDGELRRVENCEVGRF
jgi:hypothetical protein